MIIFTLLWGLISVLLFVFWVWMLVHAITNTGLPSAEKIVWVLVIFFLPLLGAILYYFLGKPKGRPASGVL